MALLILALLQRIFIMFFFFFSSRRRHTRFDCDWSSDVCSSDLARLGGAGPEQVRHLARLRLQPLGPLADGGERGYHIVRQHPLAVETTPSCGAAVVRHQLERSEERRVGKECRARWWPDSEIMQT